MAKLIETIATVAARARKYRDRGLGEQNTKTSLIEPVLSSLGWEVQEPDEVYKEFRPHSKANPVDYALRLQRKARVFVEAKGLGESIADHKWIAQVLGYCTVAGVEWCVLTDGDEYRFYNATAPVPAEEKMFCRVRLTEGTPNDSASALALLSKSNLSQNHLDALWVSHFVDRRVKAALTDILGSPGKQLVQLVRSRAPKLSSKEVADSIRRLTIQLSVQVPAVHPTKPVSGRSSSQPRARTPSSALSQVSLLDVINAKLLSPPTRIFKRYLNKDLEAVIRADGTVVFNGQEFRSCSTAAAAARAVVTGRPMSTNGWEFWRYEGANGKPRLLDELRQAIVAKSAKPSLRLSSAQHAS